MTLLFTAAVDQTMILEDGIPVQETKFYGIGIDCHSKFIQVCVLAKQDLHFYAHQKEFGTYWDSLVSAKDWCIHVLLAFGGAPNIVNPTLTGASRRKTDVLDAQMLATHDLVGVWRESYIPSPDISELRVLVWERDRCLMESTAASRRINNVLVRFGYILGRDGSVAKEGCVRDIVEPSWMGKRAFLKTLVLLAFPTMSVK